MSVNGTVRKEGAKTHRILAVAANGILVALTPRIESGLRPAEPGAGVDICNKVVVGGGGSIRLGISARLALAI